MGEATRRRTRRTVLRTGGATVGALLTAGVGAAGPTGDGVQVDDCVRATADVGAWLHGCPRLGHVALVPEGTRGVVQAVCETNDMVEVRWDHATGDGWVDESKLADC